MRIAVITASIGEGGRSNVYTPQIDARPKGVEYRLFTDRELTSPFWDVQRVERMACDSCRDAKRYKVLAHQYLEGFDASIWIDRHCRLLVDPVELFAEFAEDVLVVNHWRSCIYHEANVIMQRKKDNDSVVRSWVHRMRLERWKSRAGLYFGGFIARRHTDEARKFSELWWNYIENGSRRDQLSLPVALHRSGVRWRRMPRSERERLFMIGGK